MLSSLEKGDQYIRPWIVHIYDEGIGYVSKINSNGLNERKSNLGMKFTAVNKQPNVMIETEKYTYYKVAFLYLFTISVFAL